MDITSQESHVLLPTYQHPFPLNLEHTALLVIDLSTGQKI